MTQVQQWAGGLCLLILVTTVIQYILPGGVMQRSVKLVLGGFVVLGVIVPLTQLVSSNSWELPNFEQSATMTIDTYITQTNTRILEQAEGNVAAVIADQLAQRGISAENIAVNMDSNEDNSIVIEKAVVTLSSEDTANAEEIRERLQNILEIPVEVIIYGGG